MAGKTAELTTREKAAIIYKVITGEPWTECYKIASKSDLTKLEKSKNLAVLASSWNKSHKVQTFLKEFQIIQNNKLETEINEAIQQDRNKRGDSESTTGETTKRHNIIDYSDPKNRQQLYNRVIANASDDPKTQLDAAKMFEQIQRDDREAARAQKQSRVYLPLTCNECPLYNRARKQTTK